MSYGFALLLQSASEVSAQAICPQIALPLPQSLDAMLIGGWVYVDLGTVWMPDNGLKYQNSLGLLLPTQRIQGLTVLFLLPLGLIFGCTPAATDSGLSLQQQSRFVATVTKQPIAPLTEPMGLTQAKVALGKVLFYDARLSHDNSVSCASCHDMNKGGADGLRTAVGIGGQVGQKNTPTVLNSSLSLAQFWDGRVRTLEEQASGPIHNPIEMGSDWEEVVHKLKRDAKLVAQFHSTYRSSIKPELIVDAIATFERSLITTDSPFDHYLRGDESAIPPQAISGYALFREIGCTSCHQGRAVGGNMFQKFGVMATPLSDHPDAVSDEGRFVVTERTEDMHRYKVPSLRNVDLTAPYFHDGRTETLADAIREMALYQLGTELSDTEVQELEMFLKSLTGKIKSDWL